MARNLYDHSGYFHTVMSGGVNSAYINRLWWPLLLAIALSVLSCNSAKRVSSDQAFFKKYKIKSHGAPGEEVYTADELDELVKLRPNRQVLIVRFNLMVYNLFAPRDWTAYYERKAEKRDLRNDRRLEHGRDSLKTRQRTGREWLCYTVGEPPVVIDSARILKSAEQMNIYLRKKGCFKNVVYPEIRYKHDQRRFRLIEKAGLSDTTRHGAKAKVIYHIYPGQVFHIRSIRYHTSDTLLSNRMEYFREHSLLEEGMVFDIDRLDKERETITDYLNNHGYYDFTKDFISYDADSTVADGWVDIDLHLRSLRMESLLAPDSLIDIPHRKYFIGSIEIHTQYNPIDPQYEPADTLALDGASILSNGYLPVSTRLLMCTINLQPGQMYRKEDVDNTYKRLSQLQLFRSVSIQLAPRPGIPLSQPQQLDCKILLTPAKRQSFSVDPRLIHRDDNFGVYGNFNYRHRNVIRGAETFEFRGLAGFEATRVLTQSVDATTGEQVTQAVRPNTFEVGAEAGVRIPRLVPFGCDRFSKSIEPTTSFTAAVNYQSRPDFERTLSQFRINYNWTENADRVSKIYLDPAEFSIIRIDKSQEFDDYLAEIQDDFLSNAYNNHLINASGLGWVLNTQKMKRQRSYWYNRTGVEWAGFLPRAFFDLTGREKDDNGGYRIFDIRFSHYVKLEEDLRYYWNINQKNTLVARASAGVGQPFANLNVLPFEKSFFAGGSNDIRAWRARSLGPGSFRDTTTLRTFNAIGEMKLEFNLEFRFDLTRTFEGAFFMDAGNIWLLDAREDKPGSEFDPSRFAGEIALGAGAGARLDFEFFLLRFDFGMQVKDPAKVEGERWFWEPKTEYTAWRRRLPDQDPNYTFFPSWTFNLGIGYPF
ncbi:MAG: BamA/TamA family outer membrane protein [Flavobacteriales bacterium]|nr:BamA/TamA family outer membrane protein [Flavobacteriales bacterium]